MKYNITRINKEKEFTLFLPGGPGQQFDKYDKDFKDINFLSVDYFDSENTKEIIKDILKIIKDEDINITTIIGFSFGTYVGHYLLKYLKPKTVHFIGTVGDSYKESHNTDERKKMRELQKDFLNKQYKRTLKDKDYRRQEEETLKLAGYEGLDINIDETVKRSVDLSIKYCKNKYYEYLLEEVEINDLKDIKFYFYGGMNDNLTNYDLILDYITDYRLEDKEVQLEDVGHTFSYFIKYIKRNNKTEVCEDFECYTRNCFKAFDIKICFKKLICFITKLLKNEKK